MTQNFASFTINKDMFKNLTDLKYTRTSKEAFGFYLAYLLLTVILSATFGAILGLFLGDSAVDLGHSLGTLVAVIISMGLALYLLKIKKLKSFKYLLIACVAGLLSLFGGGLLGLIPASYLTTKKK